MIEPSRSIPFDAVFNFRDLGGYRAGGGRAVRWRRLFRADGLHRLRPVEGERIRELGIATVIDLRTPEEVATRGRFPEDIAGVEYHHLPMFDVEPEWPPEDDNPTYLADRYAEMLEEGRATVATSLRLLADDSSYPLVFHCAAGKDRTGILAAVILGLLGVPEDVIAEDYALSHAAMAGLQEWVQANMPDVADAQSVVPPSVFGAEAKTMAAFLEHIGRTHGSVEGLVRDLGVGDSTINQIRDALLAPD